MSHFYVYILRSDKGRHYIGYTSNFVQRLSQHNRKHKGFTGTSEKWETIAYRELPDKNSAHELEKFLKSFKNCGRALEYINSL